MFGGQKGIAGFNEALSKHYPLVCLCSSNNEPADNVLYKVLSELPTSKQQFFQPAVWNKIVSVARKENPSFIILEHPYHAIGAKKAMKATGAKLILHSHNIESERFRHLGKWWWRFLRSYEKGIHGKATLSIFKTELDRDFAIEQFGLEPGKCIVIPYGIERPVVNQDAETMIRERHKISSEERIFLFAGTLDYQPNADAVENIHSRIIPALEKSGIAFKIIICGRNRDNRFGYLEEYSDPHVINVGEVGDIDNYFQAADMFINPVLTGGGIQTKNIDAIANHCSVICFDSMTTGLPAGICGNKLSAVPDNDWQAFVDKLIQASKHKERTPESFFTYFDWQNCITPLLKKLKTL